MKLKQISFCCDVISSLWFESLFFVRIYCYVICDKKNDYAVFCLAVAGSGMNYDVEQTVSSKLGDVEVYLSWITNFLKRLFS